jgi:PAS domain-containing protein
MPNTTAETPDWLREMETILEELNEGVVVVDNQLRVIFANEAPCSTIGRLLLHWFLEVHVEIRRFADAISAAFAEQHHEWRGSPLHAGRRPRELLRLQTA